jgi:hypothetical protein
MKTVRCSVRFDGAAAAGSILGRIARASGFVLTILRARMTPTDAWVELELSGPGSRLGRVLRMLPGRA